MHHPLTQHLIRWHWHADSTATDAELPSSPLQEPHAMLRLLGVAFILTLSLSVYLAPVSHAGLSPGETWPWLLCMLAFLVLFVAGTFQPDTLRGRQRGLWLAALQSLLGIAANVVLNGNSLSGGLLLLIMAQVTVLVNWRTTFVWALLHSLALLVIFRTYWVSADVVSYPAGFFYFQLFAAAAMRIAVRESRSRARLHEVVDELRSTRTLLHEATRKAERLSLSREVHDVLGHHLTALSMNLQLARHAPQPGETQHYVQQAEEATQSLMREVRQTVHGLRDEASSDLGTELQSLVSRVPIQVDLNLPAQDYGCCPVVTHVLLRCVQEILTNAVRHGQATRVSLDFQRVGPTLRLHAHDNGRGAPHLHFGCGLSGMRERLDSLGGQLDVQTRPGRGVALFLSVPLREHP